MADLPPPGPRLHVVADLDIRVGDERGSTRAHLGNDANDLVLEVDDPAVLVRAAFAPGGRALRGLTGRIPPELYGTSVRIRSGPRDLGRVGVGDRGRLRVAPTVAGVALAGRTLTSSPRGRHALGWGALTVAAIAIARAVRRPTASSH